MEKRAAPGIRGSISLIMLFQVSALMIRSWLQTALTDTGFDVTVAKYSSALAGFLVLGFLMWPVLTKVWPGVRAQFRRPESWGRMIMASTALGILLWIGQMLALLIVAAIKWGDAGFVSYASWPVYQVSCRNVSILLLSIPVMSLFTPLIEETINRGLVFQILLRKGPVPAVMGSAFLFAVLHEPSGMPNAFVFGVFAAVQLLHYRSLWAVTITHGVANLLVESGRICLNGYWLPGNIGTGAWNPAPLACFAFIACLAIAWWLANYRGAGVATETDHPG